MAAGVGFPSITAGSTPRRPHRGKSPPSLAPRHVLCSRLPAPPMHSATLWEADAECARKRSPAQSPAHGPTGREGAPGPAGRAALPALSRCGWWRFRPSGWGLWHRLTERMRTVRCADQEVLQHQAGGAHGDDGEGGPRENVERGLVVRPGNLGQCHTTVRAAAAGSVIQVCSFPTQVKQEQNGPQQIISMRLKKRLPGKSPHLIWRTLDIIAP